MAEPTTGTTIVTDHRTPPRGVLPRGAQTWLMVALALGILAIIVLTGRPEPPARPAAGPVNQALAPSPDRLRDYQDRLRVLDERGRQQALVDPADPRAPLLYEDARTAAVDPLADEKKRREYESLFASNVVVSRRPDGERPSVPTVTASAARGARGLDAQSPAPPSLDEVAEAVMRATARSVPPPAPQPAATAATPQGGGAADGGRPRPAFTDPIQAAGPLHRLLEGTFIDAVLTNRLDGTSAAPVNCLVTNPVFSHSGQHILIPGGARVLGETKPVQSLGETRLAVSFHRLVFPDGRTYALDQFIGLNQVGDAGLRDRVNQHYLSTFGASAAVGLITGLSQFIGTAGLGRADGNRSVIIAGGVGDATGQSTAQVMSRFLNRLPTITIREGHRVKVYLTGDIELPVYEPGHIVARQP
ncbi:MAG: TrbI/VirB10 family protein [Vicinamibacterales bacterium]